MTTLRNGELTRNINQSVGKFGAKGLTMANRVCLALESMLGNARDYAMVGLYTLNAVNP